MRESEPDPEREPVSAEAFLGGDDGRHIELHIMEDLFPSVTTFQLCDLHAIGGGFGVSYTGITATEIEAAVRLARISRDERDQVVSDVKYMGSVAASGRNQQIAAQANSKR